jgi:hypothetical protein
VLSFSHNYINTHNRPFNTKKTPRISSLKGFKEGLLLHMEAGMTRLARYQNQNNLLNTIGKAANDADVVVYLHLNYTHNKIYRL